MGDRARHVAPESGARRRRGRVRRASLPDRAQLVRAHARRARLRRDVPVRGDDLPVHQDAGRRAARARRCAAGRAVAQVWGMALLAAMAGIVFQINTLSFAYHPVLWLFLAFIGAWYSAVRHHRPELKIRLTLPDVAIVVMICVHLRDDRAPAVPQGEGRALGVTSSPSSQPASSRPVSSQPAPSSRLRASWPPASREPSRVRRASREPSPRVARARAQA